MSKEYKRDKSKSMVDLAVAISTNNENQEGENWTDVINICGEGDMFIVQLEASLADKDKRIADLLAQLAKLQEIIRALRGTFVDIGYKLCVSRIDDHLERLHVSIPALPEQPTSGEEAGK